MPCKHRCNLPLAVPHGNSRLYRSALHLSRPRAPEEPGADQTVALHVTDALVVIQIMLVFWITMALQVVR